jgi:hypothetical protein
MSWKQEYLILAELLREFVSKNFADEPELVSNYIGGVDDLNGLPNSVRLLTRIYLLKSAELLHADVNGALEDVYKQEYVLIKDNFEHGSQRDEIRNRLIEWYHLKNWIEV